jgi:uncharacterized DUF497 family protein
MMPRRRSSTGCRGGGPIRSIRWRNLDRSWSAKSIRGRLLFVVITTDAEGKMRIISARRATKRERHAYEDE